MTRTLGHVLVDSRWSRELNRRMKQLEAGPFEKGNSLRMELCREEQLGFRNCRRANCSFFHVHFDPDGTRINTDDMRWDPIRLQYYLLT